MVNTASAAERLRRIGCHLRLHQSQASPERFHARTLWARLRPGCSAMALPMAPRPIKPTSTMGLLAMPLRRHVAPARPAPAAAPRPSSSRRSARVRCRSRRGPAGAAVPPRPHRPPSAAATIGGLAGAKVEVSPVTTAIGKPEPGWAGAAPSGSASRTASGEACAAGSKVSGTAASPHCGAGQC